MTNETNLPDYDDDHIVETFGPLEPEDDVMELFASGWDESHYFHTIRDFEELLRDYGVQRVITDMDEETVASLMEYFDE